MPVEAITEDARGLDLSSRFIRTNTVAASPTAATETIIATLTVPENLTLAVGIEVVAWAAYTVGTSGTAGNLRIRRTDASGTVIAATGALTVTATNLVTASVHGTDTGPTLPGQVYVATLTVTGGAAASTVSAVHLRALLV